jgi:hypothetical protein
LARDVTRDDVVDFVVADATRVAFLAPAGFDPLAFAQSTEASLSPGEPAGGIVDVHFVPARGTVGDRVVVLERERLSIYDVPFTAGISPVPAAAAALAIPREGKIGSATADVDGDGLHELLVFTGLELHAVSIDAFAEVVSMTPVTLLADDDFDRLMVLDVNRNVAPDVLLLNTNTMPHIGTTNLTLVLDLFATPGALASPFAAVHYKFDRDFDPELIAVGDFDGVVDALEIAVFEVGGAAACIRLDRATFAMSACADSTASGMP